MNADEVLARLDALGETITKLDSEAKLAYAKRLALFKKGRALGVSYEKMAGAAGVTEAAVIMALRKAMQQNLAAEHRKALHRGSKKQSCPLCYPRASRVA